MVHPFFAVSRLQGFFDQSQEAIVSDILSQDIHQGLVLDIIEAPFDVSLDKPFGPLPRFVDINEGRMAALVWSETVAVL